MLVPQLLDAFPVLLHVQPIKKHLQQAIKQLSVQREREVCLALGEADAAREVTASGSFSTDMTAQAFPAASSGIPCVYESDVMHHPVTGEEHAYIMQQLLGPSLHELVDEGYVTRETFLPVPLPVLQSLHIASTHSFPSWNIATPP